jgi:hypothetical protein
MNGLREYEHFIISYEVANCAVESEEIGKIHGKN